MRLRIIRDQVLANNIVFIDGMSRSGKSLIAPLISSFDRGELWHLDHIYEYLATLHHFKKIDEEAAVALMKLYADFDIYNTTIGRYTNFRKDESSSAHTNLLAKRQIQRMKGSDGDVIVPRIRKRNPVLVLMVHYIFQASGILFNAFQNRLKLYIISARHPAFLVDGWHCRDWNHRFNINPRDFQICVNVKGKKVPWFAAEDPGYYLSLGPLEQSIYVVHSFTKNIEQKYKRFPRAIKEKIMLIPFEPFAADPIPYIRQIAKKTKSKITPLTRQILDQVSLPRPFNMNEINRKRNQIHMELKKRKASKQIWSMFDSLCMKYEKEYLTPWYKQ